jgi:peptide/nickel transport system ATP-binding protein
MYAGKLAEKAPSAEIVASPRHPYTDLLVSSLPEVGVRFAEQRLKGIPGRPPSLLDPPAGCRFAARCPLAAPECRVEPPFAALGPEHRAACWKAAA